MTLNVFNFCLYIFSLSFRDIYKRICFIIFKAQISSVSMILEVKHSRVYRVFKKIFKINILDINNKLKISVTYFIFIKIFMIMLIPVIIDP